MAVTRSQLPQRLVLSILIVSDLFSKLLHIYQHRSLPLTSLVLYFPTFFIVETLLFVAVWLLLNKTSGLPNRIALVFSGLLACLILVAASSQCSFFIATGGEIRWSAAKTLGASEHGLKLMLSGLLPTVVSSTVLLVVSWFATAPINRFMFRWLGPLFDSSWSDNNQNEVLPTTKRSPLAPNRSRLWTLGGVVVTLALLAFRPPTPYNHMTGALPFTMFSERPTERKAAPTGDEFPLPDLVDEEHWEPAHDHFGGWEPDVDIFAAPEHERELPAWAQDALPPGFVRWAPRPDNEPEEQADSDSSGKNETKRERLLYDPTRDPLRITNMDQDLLGPLKAALDERAIPINHIVFVFLESGRKDLFPLKKDSHLYQQILETNQENGAIKEADLAKLHGRLSRLTAVAEKLTGESSGFNSTETADNESATQSEYSGLNFDGVVTGSTLSAKSRIANYCGVGPLPVDFMYENGIMPYQPCLMHILELFNRRKASTTSSDGSVAATEKQWKSIYAQSVTGGFQDQFKLIDLLGFNESWYSEEISRKSAKHWHEGMEKINYFGYPETEVLPYMRDAINETLSNNKRLFLSHFTSTTHHPWGTPKGFGREEYFGHEGPLSRNRDMDNYLNACHFVDEWLADVMGLLNEAGIEKETLTVFVGDHGQAFKQDAKKSGTYENPHISNFRVPLLFHHPLLPRMQISANASTVSILPTILDLLITTDSLNAEDRNIALDLVNEYEGQSLIRPYQVEHGGREAWNMGVINAGGSLLSISSAATPFRLVMPLIPDTEYYFTHLESDPYEESPITDWTAAALSGVVGLKHGKDAENWVLKAEQVGNWWVKRQQALWDYDGSKSD